MDTMIEPTAALRELSYADAIYEALFQAMTEDERVFLLGEDIGVYGGAFQVTRDLFHLFGGERVIDTPIAELGAAGVAVGAALAGGRPILEFQFSDFATLAMEQIVNQAAKISYMLGVVPPCRWSCGCPPARAPALPPSTARASKPGSAIFPV